GGNNIPARKFPKPSFWPKVKKRSKISRCRVLPESRHMAGKLRHSRESGNLGRSVRKLIGKKGFLRFYVLDSRFRGNDGMYSELNLNQYGVASPCRTVRGFAALS
ncbi:TPA: hypothetical protein ACE8LD_002148, partial [Neisseria gonorrhoeae]